MHITDMTQTQQAALLDLLILGMYADAHLASTEDARLHRFLSARGLHALHERSREIDDAVTRVRRRSSTQETSLSYAAELAREFTTPDAQQAVLSVLQDIMSSDSRVAEEETQLLSEIRELFRK